MPVAIIGGSGFGTAFTGGEPTVVETEYGAASVIHGRTDAGADFIFLARHGAGHTVAPHNINHRANIAALLSLGVTAIYATAAVGSLKLALSPGHFVIFDDFIDLTKGEVQTFFSKPGRVRHTDMGEPYSMELRRKLLDTARGGGAAMVHSRGTYVCVSGPRYETPAEIKMMAAWGGDVVGMTGAPEAILAREASIPYAGVGIVTNYGCGLRPGHTLSHTEVEAQMEVSREGLRAWLMRALDGASGDARR
ncbi:putative 6-oxopurine nucleoside phosphorylase [Capsulimonas corticalis]|uniref:Purine nucleoside phosphorylase n=1 Tax=Capsulimonas corticalis TaxID=2219043 RepID=A0A402D3I1_9BACT|nr:MTAP family purine nucleoside phosphorylase [Capsulimonas corticalis]BDI31856.1 putative 6-oxopurine nucleoside phosphorylase [Capsulimonas corticalis]